MQYRQTSIVQFISKSKEVLDIIPEEECAKTVKDLTMMLGEPHLERALSGRDSQAGLRHRDNSGIAVFIVIPNTSQQNDKIIGYEINLILYN